MVVWIMLLHSVFCSCVQLKCPLSQVQRCCLSHGRPLTQWVSKWYSNNRDGISCFQDQLALLVLALTFFVHVNCCLFRKPWMTLKWGTVSWWMIPFVLFAVSLLLSLQFSSHWLQALIVRFGENLASVTLWTLSCYPSSSCEMYSHVLPKMTIPCEPINDNIYALPF